MEQNYQIHPIRLLEAFTVVRQMAQLVKYFLVAQALGCESVSSALGKSQVLDMCLPH